MTFSLGCNAIFGIEPTRAIDAGFFDAPADAPYSCPPIGEPMFGPLLGQVLAPRCKSYVPSPTWGNAMAACSDANFVTSIYEGPIDAPMQPAAMPRFNPTFELTDPRLSPEGDRAIVSQTDQSRHLYARDPDRTWRHLATLATGVEIGYFSTPSRAPDRRVIAIRGTFADPSLNVVEYRLDDSGLAMLDMYPLSTTVGTTDLSFPSLSEDGLRLVAQGRVGTSPGIVYATRPDLVTRFARFSMLTTVPTAAVTPTLSQDCGRIYFSAIDTVLFLRQ